MEKDNSDIEYVDDYDSCEMTYVILSFCHEKLDSGMVTKLLLIEPTGIIKKNKHRKISKNSWFFSTQDLIESRDARRHLRFLFDTFKNKETEFDSLRYNGWSTILYCFWGSTEGNGGPLLDYRTMELLSMFKLDIHFNLWWTSR